MSTKKLCLVGGVLLIFQVLAFLVGGLTVPRLTPPLTILAAKCIDIQRPHHATKWLLPWGNDRCKSIRNFDKAASRLIEANDIVFSVHIPFQGQEMSPWFQFMLINLRLDIAFKLNNFIGENAMVALDVALAYRDELTDPWTEMAHSVVQRKLQCTFPAAKTEEHEGRYYECNVIPFIELAMIHKYFLLNIRLPVNEHKKINVGIGEINDLRLVIYGVYLS